jgi:hypothetical protein
MIAAFIAGWFVACWPSKFFSGNKTNHKVNERDIVASFINIAADDSSFLTLRLTDLFVQKIRLPDRSLLC